MEEGDIRHIRPHGLKLRVVELSEKSELLSPSTCDWKCVCVFFFIPGQYLAQFLEAKDQIFEKLVILSIYKSIF